MNTGYIGPYRIGHLPRDMVELIRTDFWNKYKDPFEKRLLQDLEVPLLKLPVLDYSFPSVEMETDHRTIEYALSIDLDKAPPILVSHCSWLDGRHRVCKAIREGRETILAIDLTSILPWFDPQGGDGLGEITKGAKKILLQGR